MHQPGTALPQQALRHARPDSHLSSQDIDALLHAWGRMSRVAQAEDALATWQYGAIAAVTVVIALAAEAWWHREGGGRLRPGFRGGALMGLLVAATVLFALGWLAARALTSGAIKCMGGTVTAPISPTCSASGTFPASISCR